MRQHGGQNKVLSEPQITVIYKYMEDSYLSGYGATKAMVFAAITTSSVILLRAAFLAWCCFVGTHLSSLPTPSSFTNAWCPFAVFPGVGTGQTSHYRLPQPG